MTSNGKVTVTAMNEAEWLLKLLIHPLTCIGLGFSRAAAAFLCIGLMYGFVFESSAELDRL